VQILVLDRHHPVARINPCPDFVFTIKNFPILITMTSSRRSAPSGRMTTPKRSSTLSPKFSQKSRAPGPNLSGLRRGHTSGHQNPRQRPATPRVAKSATIRSDLTCATVTISQAAFIQPLKQGQGTSITSPFYCNLCHGADHFRVLCPFPAIPSWNGRNLSHQLKPTCQGRKYPRIPHTQTSLLVATLQPTTTRTT
jgi:hypothetical protein